MASEEIGQASPTDEGRLAGLIDDATTLLVRVEQERATAAAPPEVHTLQGTPLTDAGRLLTELRSGHQALTTQSCTPHQAQISRSRRDP
ncbi:hypothetical protein AB0D66_33750 [Streptomyces sp. NPDC048270]|uniref:hypothetical protein n=1 Tax=Streptomyces sp. NPDC048270 TaxID=3154615 RepID=UPI0033DA8FE2